MRCTQASIFNSTSHQISRTDAALPAASGWENNLEVWVSTKMSAQKVSTPARIKRSRNQKGKDRSSKRARRQVGEVEGSATSSAGPVSETTPVFLHKLLEYKRRGNAQLSDVQHKVVAFIERHFHVPEDFERSHKFGPLSGMCFEERLIAAYANELLEPRVATGNTSDLRICTNCGKHGHTKTDCPAAF